MSDGLVMLALALASYRLWRLIAVDGVTAAIRKRVFFPDDRSHRKLLYDLVSCAWCLGSWIAFAAVAGVWAVRPLPLPALWFGAVAAGVGLIQAIDEALEPGSW